MDEFPEFPRHVLETLRQPIETGEVMVARANAHVKYPSRFMLIAAANPCRCGYMSDPARACARATECGADYLGRIPGRGWIGLTCGLMCRLSPTAILSCLVTASQAPKWRCA